MPQTKDNMNLPAVLDAQQLRTLDVAGLQEQLGLAQKALEVLHELRKDKHQELITKQNALYEAQKQLSQVKVEIKDLVNNTAKFNERIKTLKILIKAEGNSI